MVYEPPATYANYGNEDLLPNIKINTDAMSRTIPFIQEDFVKISESWAEYRDY
jgi:hypothetical protein